MRKVRSIIFFFMGLILVYFVEVGFCTVSDYYFYENAGNRYATEMWKGNDDSVYSLTWYILPADFDINVEMPSDRGEYSTILRRSDSNLQTYSEALLFMNGWVGSYFGLSGPAVPSSYYRDRDPSPQSEAQVAMWGGISSGVSSSVSSSLYSLLPIIALVIGVYISMFLLKRFLAVPVNGSGKSWIGRDGRRYGEWKSSGGSTHFRAQRSVGGGFDSRPSRSRKYK